MTLDWRYFLPAGTTKSLETLILSRGITYIPNAYLPDDGEDFTNYFNSMWFQSYFGVSPRYSLPLSADSHCFAWFVYCPNSVLTKGYTKRVYAGKTNNPTSWFDGSGNDSWFGGKWRWTMAEVWDNTTKRIVGTNISDALLAVYTKFDFEDQSFFQIFYLIHRALTDDCYFDLTPYGGTSSISLHSHDWVVQAAFTEKTKVEDFRPLLFYDPDRPQRYTVPYIATNAPLTYVTFNARLRGQLPIFLPFKTFVGLIPEGEDFCGRYNCDIRPLFNFFVCKSPPPCYPNDFFAAIQDYDYEFDRDDWDDGLWVRLNFSVIRDDLDYYQDFNPPKAIKDAGYDITPFIERFIGRRGILIQQPYNIQQRELVVKGYWSAGKWFVTNVVKRREVVPDTLFYAIPNQLIVLRPPIVVNMPVISDLGGYAHFTEPYPFDVTYSLHEATTQLPKTYNLRPDYFWGLQSNTGIDLSGSVGVEFSGGQVAVRLSVPLTLMTHKTNWKEVDYEIGGELVRWIYGNRS